MKKRLYGSVILVALMPKTITPKASRSCSVYDRGTEWYIKATISDRQTLADALREFRKLRKIEKSKKRDYRWKASYFKPEYWGVNEKGPSFLRHLIEKKYPNLFS